MSTETVVTRPLEARDVPEAVRLVNAEGWAFDELEFHRMLALGGGVAVDVGGALTGLLTLITHSKLAWIGNVAVRPEARGKRLGARLVDAALAAARARRVETVGLFSVLPAVSLYERAGFRGAGRVVSWRGVTDGSRRLPANVAPLTLDRVNEVARFDAPLAGDDRSRMLRVLAAEFPASSFVLEDARGIRGFVVAKTSRSGAEIGPLVARSGDAAALAVLFDAALAALAPGTPVEAGAHVENAEAVALLRERGFEESFPALAMYWGAPGREADARAVGAVAGMEKG